MSGEITSGSATEQKQRITRSSIGQVTPTPDLVKADDAAIPERSVSPATTKSSQRSRTSTPTQETSAVVTSNAGSTDQTNLDTVAPPSINPPSLVKRKMGMTTTSPVQGSRRSLRSNKLNIDEESDKYCWICRKDGIVVPCQLCPRVYHLKCLGLSSTPKDDWICVECEKVMRSECEDTRPKALSSLSIDQLITCLQFALERMKVPNSEVFQVPVDPAMEPEYHNIVAHPMDMSTLDKNITKKVYGSTEAFLADAKWILHNSIIYNGMHNKYTMTAKAILKACRNQMSEIETCPDCFLASCTQESNWFCKPCRYSHPLVWAKLKGYPFWPAKALREVDGQVDCRFFGAHDKAWVPSHQVFMLSSEPPVPVKNKKGSGFEEAMNELEKYIAKFKARYGSFTYCTVREPYRPDYGQPSTLNPRKRPPLSDNEAEPPPNKKLAEESVVEKDAPTVKVEPNRPGVFTISDEMLAGATNMDLSGLKDEVISPNPVNSVANKIEEKLRSAIEHEQTLVSAPTHKFETTVNGESGGNDKSVVEENGGSIQLNGILTSQPSTLSTPVQTPDTTSSNTSNQPQPTSQLVNSDQSKTNSLTKDPSTPPNHESMDVTSKDDSSGKTLIPPTDEEYTAKLGKTIDSCRSKLGIDESQVKEESGDSESESDSNSEEEVENHKGRRRRYYGYIRPTQRVDVRDIMSDKERAVTDQLLDLMKDGLESTIKSIVRQSFLQGKPSVPADTKPAPSSTDTTTTTITTDNTTTPAPTQNTPATDEPAASGSSAISEGVKPTLTTYPVKSEDGVAKTEPPTDVSTSTLSEPTLTNTQPINSEPVSSELVEKLTWKHKCEIDAIKHNAELAAMESRKSIELEKERALWRLRKQLEHKFKKIIEETKKKQWCAMCGKEAIFYCCWNTSYCDYPCQQKHWPSHLKTCAQISKDDAGDKKQQQRQSPAPSTTSGNERGQAQGSHASAAPPPYMSAPSSSSNDIASAPQYQIMQGQVQYMPAAAVAANTSHVYQAQLPVQPMHMQSGGRSQVSPAGAPLLYPVMTPPTTAGPPQPQSYMLSQRPYRLAPKYN